MKQLAILVTILVVTSLQAQNIKRFRHLTIDEGLAHTDATCFEQDDMGFIWIGTNSGLNKYDGRSVKTFKNNTLSTGKIYSNRIWSLCKQGDLLWVGSEQGLQLFDLKKEKFKVFSYEGNSNNIVQGTVKSIKSIGHWLFVKVSGRLYVCNYISDENKIKIRPIEELLDEYPEWFPIDDIKSFATDDNSCLWLAANKGVIAFSIHDDLFEFEEVHRTSNNTIGLDFSGSMWFIDYWDDRLWISKGQKLHIVSLNSKTHRIRNLLKTIDLSEILSGFVVDNASPVVTEITVDEYENLWGVTKEGLFLMEDPLSEHSEAKLIRHSVTDPLSLSSNHLSSLFVDGANTLWVGSWGGGVSILNLAQKKFNLLMHDINMPATSLSSPFVRAINEDENGNIWIGLKDKGVDIYNPFTGRVTPLCRLTGKKNNLSSTEVRSICKGENVMYVGTSNGLNRINTSNYNNKIYKQEVDGGHLPNSAIYAIEIDHYNQVWCGTWGGGLSILKSTPNGEEFVHLNTSSEFPLSSNTITNLLFDQSRNVMFAASSKGLNEIQLDENGQVTAVYYYREHEGGGSLSGEYLWPMLKEGDSVLWIGTLGGGLNRLVFEDKAIKTTLAPYTSSAFYPGGRKGVWDIETLLEDDRGNLWLAGKGLAKFNKKAQEFWQFDVNDGLQSNGFKIGAAHKATDGTLYFGGINGLNYFRPEEIKASTNKPKVSLTNLSVQNKVINSGQVLNNRKILTNTLAYTDELRLNYLENDFSISFSAMHYANPSKCSYKYMLKGYDDDWVFEKGEYPIANYSNLKYGDYVFMVKASNHDGIFSDDITELKVHIDAPWWLSFWAFVVYVVFVLAATLLVRRHQLKLLTMRNNLKMVEAEEAKKEELHQMKLQFFTNISHEFKTPLTLILSPIEKMLHSDVSDSERKDLLCMVDKNAKRMLSLVNELMDFRKSERGKMNLKYHESNLTHLLNEVLGYYTAVFKQKNIDLKVEASDVNVFVDDECVTKIINNLVSNAIKFTEDNGGIEMVVFRSRIEDIKPSYKYEHRIGSEFVANEYAIFRIKDSGSGITKSSIGQVFDRFYNVSTKSNQHLGTGIGLALVKSLVLLHEGQVIVSSERNVGTEILVAFPLGKEHIGKQEIDNDAESNFSVDDIIIDGLLDEDEEHLFDDEVEEAERAMLVVEDNADVRKLLVDHFKDSFVIFEAENGRVGIDMALKETPDIIISDIMMPEVDGLELCKTLKQDLNTSHIPIIMLTAKSSMEDQIESAESGADAYIPKPFSIRLLDAKVDGLLDHFEKIKEKYASDVFASTREIVKSRKDQEFIDKLIELIDKNMDDDEFSVSDLCRELGIGRTNLYKKIKSLTGQSLGVFIRTLRLKRAAKILVSEDVSITEVIYRVGINSNSYFTKAFKAQFGVTPSEFVANKGDVEIDLTQV